MMKIHFSQAFISYFFILHENFVMQILFFYVCRGEGDRFKETHVKAAGKSQKKKADRNRPSGASVETRLERLE